MPGVASLGVLMASALVTLGVSGAWIGNLRVLEPYKPLFVAGAAIFIALGFWRAYFRPRAKCADGSYCARPQAALITQVGLWLAAALVTLAATVDWWAPLFY